MTRDPIGYEGGINLYAFCAGNPINKIDPYGLDWWEDYQNWLSQPLDLDKPSLGTRRDLINGILISTSTEGFRSVGYRRLSSTGRGSATGPTAASRKPIFVDTNLLVAAAEKGSSNALSEIRAGKIYITINQYREFMNVNTGKQKKSRQIFLNREGISVYNGTFSALAAGTPDFQQVFSFTLISGHSRGDAALASFAKSTGFEAVTAEKRLVNFFNNSHKKLGVPIRRVTP